MNYSVVLHGESERLSVNSFSYFKIVFVRNVNVKEIFYRNLFWCSKIKENV